MTFKERLKETFSDVNKAFKRHKRYKYYAILIGYFSLALCIIIAGVSHDKKETFEPTKLYSNIALGSKDVQLINREYNPDKKVYRFDLYATGNQSGNMNDELNDKLHVDVKARSGDDDIKSKVIKVTDNYYTVFVTNLDSDYNALKITIGFDDKDANDSDLTEDMYLRSKDTKTNNNVSADTPKYELEAESIDNDIRLVNKSIERKEKEIEKLKNEITESQTNIANLNKDMKFQAGKEKENTLDQIDSLNSSIQTAKKDIAKANKSIATKKEKIELLKAKQSNILKTKQTMYKQDK